MFSLCPHGQINTRIDGFSVHQNGAGTAFPNLTAAFHTGKTQAVSQGIQKGLPVIHCQFCLFSIDGHGYDLKHLPHLLKLFLWLLLQSARTAPAPAEDGIPWMHANWNGVSLQRLLPLVSSHTVPGL